MPSPDRPLPGRPASSDLPALSDRPLTVPLLIRGSFDNGLFVTLCAITGVFCGIAIFGAVRDRDPTPAMIFFAIAAAFGVPAAAIGLYLRTQRQWLEVTLTGFVLSRRGQRRVYADDQVVGISQRSSPTTEGNLKRQLLLEVATAEGNQRIDCRYSVPPAQGDPLTGFVTRLVTGLADRTERRLDQGATLRGKGWQLSADGLHRGREVYRFDEITWAGFFDRHLCLWRGDDERPFLRIPDVSRNVHALGMIFWQRLQRRPGHDQPPAGLPLGRLLLERRSWGWAIGLVLLGLFGGITLVVFWLILTTRTLIAPQLVGYSVATTCLTLAGAIVAWTGRHGWLRFHERGVTQSGRGWQKLLRYEEIGEVVWRKDQVLILRPRPNLNRSRIRFRCVGSKFDPAVADMRDHACQHLAREWADRLPHGPLPWSPRLRFLPGGLEYRPTGLLLPSDPVSVPYEYIRFRTEGELFLLYISDQQRPTCKERTDSPNFFVGLLLLTWIHQSYQRQEAPPELADHAPRPATDSTADARFAREQRGTNHVTPEPQIEEEDG